MEEWKTGLAEAHVNWNFHAKEGAAPGNQSCIVALYLTLYRHMCMGVGYSSGTGYAEYFRADSVVIH